MDFKEDTVDSRVLTRKKNELTPEQKAKKAELDAVRCAHWRTDGRGCSKFGETAQCSRCVPGRFYVPAKPKGIVFQEDSNRVEG